MIIVIIDSRHSAVGRDAECSYTASHHRMCEFALCVHNIRECFIYVFSLNRSNGLIMIMNTQIMMIWWCVVVRSQGIKPYEIYTLHGVRPKNGICVISFTLRQKKHSKEGNTLWCGTNDGRLKIKWDNIAGLAVSTLSSAVGRRQCQS